MVEFPDLSRRTILQAALLAAAPVGARAQSGPDLGRLAVAAAIWGLPLVQIGRYFALAQASGLATNRFYLNQTLATPATRLAAPNIDTIYGFAWLDLSAGPVVLEIPDSANRYYTVQFIDAYQTILGYAGKGATSQGPGTYVIAPPGWQGAAPHDAKRIEATTQLVLALTRTFVAGDAALAEAQRLQASYTLAPLAHDPAGRLAPVIEAEALNAFPRLDLAGDGHGYFAELDALVRRFPPPSVETPVFGQLAPLALGTGAVAKLPRALLQTALDTALHKVKSFDPTVRADGWKVNYHISRFIADPLARASTNLIGPGANPAEEALYFLALHDNEGEPLSGDERYAIIFPRDGLPPVHAFWSLILYGEDLFLVDNPLSRYAITDRTTGLLPSANGSLRILVQHGLPSNTSNWLPAPSGKFRLILRTYIPDASLRNGDWKPPPVIRL